MLKIDELGLQIDSPLATPSATNFRPTTWPPSPDWAPVLDAEGKPVCLYKDSTWSLRIWGGKPKQLNFGDGDKCKTTRIDPENANLLRLLVTWKIWGPRGARSVGSILNFYRPVRAVIAMCSREGILASDLVRFPAVMDKVPKCLSPAKFKHAISVLHDILDARDSLGFILLDKNALVSLAMSKPEHSKQQTPYIPPRIWTYQVKRLRECLDDFNLHREKVEACFNFCVDSYAQNYKELSIEGRRYSHSKNPFQNPKNTGTTGVNCGAAIHGPFENTAARFEINELLDRWLGKDDGKRTLGVVRLSRYLSLVSLVGMKYLLNFSLARIKEVWDFRADCLLIEKDEKIGDIYMLCGETTKTDPDSDARWPTSPSAKVGVEAMAFIARLRIRCAIDNPYLNLHPNDISNPYLLGPSYEPWSSDGGRSADKRNERASYSSYALCIKHYAFLFDERELIINEKDMQLARLIEPNLDEDKFKIGNIWPLSYHQLRRTGAVNMLSSGLISESSLQYQLKHALRAMSLYYGHNYTRLALDPETRTVYLNTMYQSLGKELASLASSQFVSPYGDTRKAEIVSLISVSDSQKLELAGRKGEISARKIRLGFCMKRGNCEYGGIESIAHCGGGDSGAPCTHVLFDVHKAEKNKQYGIDLERRLASTTQGTPRYNALKAELKSLKNYYASIRKAR
jgi:hypothetical protein